MLPIQYLPAVHRALATNGRYGDQESLDLFVKDNYIDPPYSSEVRCCPELRGELTQPFIFPHRLLAHITGAVFKDMENSSVSFFRFSRTERMVRADYRTTEYFNIKDLRNGLPKSMPIKIKLGDLELDGSRTVHGESAQLNGLLSERFKPGESYLSLEMRDDNKFQGLEWLYVDRESHNTLRIENYGLGWRIAIGKRYDDIAHIHTEKLPADRRCRYDGRKLKAEGFLEGYAGDFSKFAYRCSGCNSTYSKLATPKQKLAAEKRERRLARNSPSYAKKTMAVAA